MTKQQDNNDTRDAKLELSIGSVEGYKLLDSEQALDGAPYAIGRGGSGIVYKARQTLYEDAYVDRAIKFFMYDDTILANDPNKKPISEEDFISEIGNVTTCNHQSLRRVIGAGVHKCKEGKIPYIVTDFIEGTTLKAVIEPGVDSDRNIQNRFIEDPDLILDFLLDVAHAIKHIHEHKYAHCDIAPKNIFIHVDENTIRPVLGDVGISKPIKKEGEHKARIIGSRKWMPERLIKYYDQEVDYVVFSSSQPFWDLYSFAKTGLKFLEIFGNKTPRSWFGSLKNDFDKACDESNAWSIDGLIERIEFLKPIHREVARVKELSMGVGSGQRKMMPVEALTTTRRLHYLVRHPALLRLAFVPQLTTANQILPGANHTRYEHTLGVIETMRRYLLSLLDESEFLEHLSTKKIEVAILSSALSCATRFPLSNIIHETKNKDKELFYFFSKNSLYMEVLRMEDSKGVALKDFIRDEYKNVEVSNVVSVLCGEFEKFDDADQLIYSILNNSLDVRVIDFVRRDSHHLGIISGDSFQIEEILPHVTIHGHKLALKIQGVSIAEQIILLRYWLFSRVYWNQPNRTFCAMARVLFIRLHECDGFSSELREKLLKLDQRGMVELLIENCQKFKLEPYLDLSQRLSGEEHTMYRVLFETSRVNKELDDQFDKLQGLNLMELDELAQLISSKLSKEVMDDSNKEIIPIIVDYPIEPDNTKMGQDVKVRVNKNEFRNLHDVSGIIGGVNDSFENQLSRFRVFIHPDLKPNKENRSQYREIARLAVIEYLGKLESEI